MTFKKCTRPCKYRSCNRNLNGCDFLWLTGEMRGCPAGNECTRFEKGKRIEGRRNESRIPSIERRTAGEVMTDLYLIDQKGRIKLAVQKGKKY